MESITRCLAASLTPSPVVFYDIDFQWLYSGKTSFFHTTRTVDTSQAGPAPFTTTCPPPVTLLASVPSQILPTWRKDDENHQEAPNWMQNIRPQHLANIGSVIATSSGGSDKYRSSLFSFLQQQPPSAIAPPLSNFHAFDPHNKSTQTTHINTNESTDSQEARFSCRKVPCHGRVSFQSIGELEKHVQESHPPKYKWLCLYEECKKSKLPGFSKTSHRDRHMRKEHGWNPFSMLNPQGLAHTEPSTSTIDLASYPNQDAVADNHTSRPGKRKGGSEEGIPYERTVKTKTQDNGTDPYSEFTAYKDYRIHALQGLSHEGFIEGQKRAIDAGAVYKVKKLIRVHIVGWLSNKVCVQVVSPPIEELKSSGTPICLVKKEGYVVGGLILIPSSDCARLPVERKSSTIVYLEGLERSHIEVLKNYFKIN